MKKQTEYNRTWRAKNKDKVAEINRAYGLRRHYGLTVAEYDSMLSSQDGVCAICRTDTPGGHGRFHVDHCHKTGKVRGLLCNPCNRMLGYAKDSATTLSSAINYLKE